MNLAVASLEARGLELADFDGICGELADDLLHEHEALPCALLWIDFPSGSREGWSYHMVAIIDGRVHDAWRPGFEFEPERYVAEAFPGEELEWEICGEVDLEGDEAADRAGELY